MAQVSLPDDPFNVLAENRRGIFYTIGGVIAILAILLLIRKKK